MKKIIITLLILAVLLVTFFIFWWWHINQPKPWDLHCAKEAKLCPDGSAVFRIAPDCEFATCPVSQATSTAHLGQEVFVLGIAITPLEVSQDSRCPVDVTCIWVGVVNLRVKLEFEGKSQETTITSGPNTDVEFNSKKIRLVGVGPAPYSTKQIQPEEYVFTFSASLN